MTVPLLEARDLHAHYGRSHVLHGISFAIEPGRSVGLLGRNGMGKTTLIRTLLGVHPPSMGRVLVNGVDVTRRPVERIVRLGIGWVPEGRQIFPNLSVRENLVLAARCGVDRRADWSFDRVLATFPRLAVRLGHGGAQLSGGEQQMLAIGRALMTNPSLLILDEATEGLAPKIVSEIWNVIDAVRAGGMASLIVDRNYRSVLARTDRCVVLEKGRVALEDTSAVLSENGAALAALLGV